jgi:hypothetical protein
LKPILGKPFILGQLREASSAYTRITAENIETPDNIDLRKLVETILTWRVIQTAPGDSEVTPEASFRAAWEADNFSNKLTSIMREPIGVTGLAERLGIRPPTLAQVLRTARRTAQPLA